MQNDAALAQIPPDDLRIPVHPADEKSILLGPYGLRAGWSLLIFILLTAILIAAVRGVHAHYYPSTHTAAQVATHVPKVQAGLTERPPVSVLVSHGLPLALLLLITWIMAKIERRRFGVYGFGGVQRVKDCVNGLISGVISLSLLVGVLWACHLLVFDGFALSGRAAMIYGFKWLGAFCLVGVAEEYMFRGYLQYTLMRGLSGMLPAGNPYRRALGFWVTATLLSVLFFLGHQSNPGESPIGLLAVFLIGMVLAYSLWRTGSLWWAIGYHITWDWMQSYFYGVGDSGTFIKGHLLATHPQGNALYSGGLTGPEGSLFVIPTGLLLLLVIRFTLPKRAQPPLIPENWPVSPQSASTVYEPEPLLG